MVPRQQLQRHLSDSLTMTYHNFQKKSPYYYKGCKCNENRKVKILMILANALLLILVFYLVNYYLSLRSSTRGAAASRLKQAFQRQPQPQQHARLRATKQDVSVIVPTKLLLKTRIGNIEITLRPDLSPETVEYVRKLAATGACERCMFYRAEKPGLLQGIMQHSNVPVATNKGSCPAGVETVANECPPWDSSCGCHGPVMTRGMVAWAAGKTGPDFFINMYAKPAVWWGTQHTVFGEIQDDASLRLFDEVIWNLPVHVAGGMHHLNEPVPFEMQLQ